MLEQSLTVRELEDAYIRWVELASEPAVGSEHFGLLDKDGLDHFDMAALRRYAYLLGIFLASLDSKQESWRRAQAKRRKDS